MSMPILEGHTIHSSVQIEWHKNTVDDKSVKVGGSQCITTLVGYSFPLKCTGSLMYLSILGKHTDEELAKCPSVCLTSNHEETLLSLTSATLKDMGSQFGHVIHSMLT